MVQAVRTSTFVHASQDGVTLAAHRGMGKALLGFDLEERLTDGLAGFAVSRRSPDGRIVPRLNRLNFGHGITATTTPGQRVWTPSDQAPFQKFRWIDAPAEVQTGQYTYEVSAMYYAGNSLRRGPAVSVSLE